MSKIQDQINDIKKDVNDILVKDATTNEKLSNIEITLTQIEEKIESSVTKLENKFGEYTTLLAFSPVQIICFSMVALIMAAFVGGLCVMLWHVDPTGIVAAGVTH